MHPRVIFFFFFFILSLQQKQLTINKKTFALTIALCIVQKLLFRFLIRFAILRILSIKTSQQLNKSHEFYRYSSLVAEIRRKSVRFAGILRCCYYCSFAFNEVDFYYSDPSKSLVILLCV